jgi:hypothetical protein
VAYWKTRVEQGEDGTKTAGSESFIIYTVMTVLLWLPIFGCGDGFLMVHGIDLVQNFSKVP